MSLAQIREWHALQRETDPELRFEAMLSLAGRMARSGDSEQATAIYRRLDVPGSVPESIRRRAHLRFEASRGQASAGARVEYLLDRFVEEALDPRMILGMGLAGAAFRATRLATLGRLLSNPGAGILTRGWGAKVTASCAGFALEGMAFPAALRAGDLLLRRDLEWNPQQLGREVFSSYLLLGAIRLGAAAVAPALAPNSSLLARRLLPQAGMFGGIYLGRRAEMALGLSTPSDQATTLLDSAAMLLQYQVAGRLTRGVLGEPFRAWERSADFQSRVLASSPRLGTLQGGESAIASPRLAPLGPALELNHAMISDGKSGGGLGGRAQNAAVELGSFNQVLRFVGEAEFRRRIQEGHVVVRIQEDLPSSLENRLEPIHSYLNILSKSGRYNITPGRRLVIHSMTSNLRVTFLKGREPGFEIELPTSGNFLATTPAKPAGAAPAGSVPAAPLVAEPAGEAPGQATRGALLKSIAIPLMQKATPDQLPELLRQAYADGGEGDGPRVLIVEGSQSQGWNPLHLNQWTQGLGGFPPRTIFQILHGESRRTYIGQVSQNGTLEWALGNGNEWRIANLRAVRSQSVRLKNPVELYLYLQALPNQTRGSHSEAELRDFRNREISILWEGPAPRTFQYDLKTFVVYSLITHIPYGKSLVIHFESGTEPIRMENYMGDLWMEEQPPDPQ